MDLDPKQHKTIYSTISMRQNRNMNLSSHKATNGRHKAVQ